MVSQVFARALATGQALFDRGEYFEAHEAWEDGWKRCTGDERYALQALIMWAAARHKRAGGHAAGAAKLVAHALEKLALVSDTFEGVDVARLRELISVER